MLLGLQIFTVDVATTVKSPACDSHFEMENFHNSMFDMAKKKASVGRVACA
jgi:hypothetical protein